MSSKYVYLEFLSCIHQIIRIRDVSSTNASLQQQKDSEIAYCKSTIEELNEQVESIYNIYLN